MSLRKVLALTLGTALAFAPCAPAATAPGLLKGTVTTIDGSRVADVDVELVNLDNGALTRLRTDANGAFEAQLDPAVRSARRVRRIVRSLRNEIVDAGSDGLRIRRVFTNPREIYRVELERPGLAYQRTTLLDRAALEELLAQDEVRSRLRVSPLAG